MKAGWRVSTFAEVLEKTETVNPLLRPNDEFEYVDVSSVSNETLRIEQTQRLIGRDAPSRARKSIRENDVLFATIRPTLKRIAIVPDELDGEVCSTGYYVLRASPLVHHRFVFYFLQTGDFLDRMAELQKGASYPAVTDSEVRSQPFRFPPLPEQQRIVGILDRAFDGIATAKANAEKNLQNARALFESHLQAVFTKHGDEWAETTLEGVAHRECTLSYGIVQPGEEFADGLAIVRPTDMTSKVIYLDGLKRIDPTLADSYKRTTLVGGELLLCVRGSTGMLSIAAPELAGGNVTRGIVPIRFDPARMTRDFGFYLMNSAVVQEQIREKTYGTALMQINIRDLRNISFSIPPLKKQEATAAALDELSEETQRLESLYQRKLTALDELKKSLLHQAFSGRL